MIYLAADHAGFKHKEKIKQYLQKKKIAFVDLGAHKLIPDDDYPDYARVVAKAVIQSSAHKGILLCATGNGMAMAANKTKGIRAALAWNVFVAQEAVVDNHANILVLPARLLSEQAALSLVRAFLTTKPSKAVRHMRRVKKI